MTRRALLSALAAVPVLRYLEPLARWVAPAPGFFPEHYFDFTRPVGCHVCYLVFDDIEPERIVSMAELARYTVENGPSPMVEK